MGNIYKTLAGSQTDFEKSIIFNLYNNIKSANEQVVENLVIKSGRLLTIETEGMRVKNVDKINQIIIPGNFGEQKILDETHLSKITNSIGISRRKSKVLVQFLRQNGIIKAVPHLIQKYANERGKLAKYFSTEYVDFEANSGQEKNRPAFFCSDLETILMLILEDTCNVGDMESDSVNPTNYTIKVGIDGGAGSVKVMIQEG